jgi:8-oxo-dGTP pyrophosphatase MutT (NUDIX family)
MDWARMDKELSGRVPTRGVEPGSVKAVGVWFLCNQTGRYLYLLRNDTKHPYTWGLPGGKIEAGETLLGGMERECIEELGSMPDYTRLMPLEKFTSADSVFEYNTWVCVVEEEFVPVLNHEHLGYAWIGHGTWPKPMHPGLWNTVNLEVVQQKLAAVEQSELAGL